VEEFEREKLKGERYEEMRRMRREIGVGCEWWCGSVVDWRFTSAPVPPRMTFSLSSLFRGTNNNYSSFQTFTLFSL